MYPWHWLSNQGGFSQQSPWDVGPTLLRISLWVTWPLDNQKGQHSDTLACCVQSWTGGPSPTDLPDHSWPRAPEDSHPDKLKYLLRGSKSPVWEALLWPRLARLLQFRASGLQSHLVAKALLFPWVVLGRGPQWAGFTSHGSTRGTPTTSPGSSAQVPKKHQAGGHTAGPVAV